MLVVGRKRRRPSELGGGYPVRDPDGNNGESKERKKVHREEKIGGSLKNFWYKH